jgi:hypothetical protein
MDVKLRPAVIEDASACGRILYDCTRRDECGMAPADFSSASDAWFKLVAERSGCLLLVHGRTRSRSRNGTNGDRSDRSRSRNRI